MIHLLSSHSFLLQFYNKSGVMGNFATEPSRALLNYDEGDIKSVHYGDILIKYPAILNIKKGTRNGD